MRDKNEKGKDYIPFGEGWEKEMMKFSKIRLIRMLADALKNKKERNEK